MNILEQLAAHAAARSAQKQKQCPERQMHAQAQAMPKGDLPFERALRQPGLSFICECKKASPSKGIIDPQFPYLQIAREYEEAGADAISVLTEPKWFMGSETILSKIAKQAHVPCLRKDFIVDAYMIDETKVLGADALLLIVALLEEPQLREHLAHCEELGLSALVEAHDEAEVMCALRCGARIIGVNNRDLKDFTVDPKRSASLRSLIPDDVLFVSESGVKDAHDIQAVMAMRADAVLIGETLMRASDRKETLAALKACQ